MTIDEAITHARETATNQRNNDKLNKTLGANSPYYNTDCLKCAEDHEQLAEWLEDYKRLKSEKEQDIYERAYRDGQDKGLSDGHFAGYNKAIDDFVEKAIEEQIQYDCPLDRHDIEKIAERLKAGGTDE